MLPQKNVIKTNLNLMVFIQEIIYTKIKDGVYVINLDRFKSIATHWIAIYVNAENVTYLNTKV